MTAVISRLNLNKTKLEKKPDYEEILNVINPDVKVQIPKRKSSDYFKSHFNITYGSLSDERVKQMEHQLLLEKFKNQYGFNKAAVDALLYANNLSAVSEYGTALSPDTEAQALDDFGGDDPAGGGGGIGTRTLQRIANIATKYVGAAVAIRPETVRDYINSFLGGPNPSPPPSPDGAAVYNIGTPQQGPQQSPYLFQQQATPMRSFLLFGSESARMRQIESGDYRPLTAAERQYLVDIYKFQNLRQQPIIPAASDLFTAEQQAQPIVPPMQGTNLFASGAYNPAAPSGAQSAASSQASLPPLQAIDPVDDEANKILQKDATENIENEDEDFDSAILKTYSEAHGIAVNGLSKGRKKTAQTLINKIDALRDELGTSSSNEALFMRIIATEEYKQFETIMREQKMTANERKDYENQLHETYLKANRDVQKAMMKWNHISEIIYRKNRGATQQATGQVVAETAPQPAPQTEQPKRTSGRARSMGASLMTRKRGNDGLARAVEGGGELPPLGSK